MLFLFCVLTPSCSEKTASGFNASAKEEKPEVTAPRIATFIFSEKKGADTLVLLDLITAEGYLRTPLSSREPEVPPDAFRLSFLSARGDTIAQSVNRSAINERLEFPQPDGSINAVEVELEEGVFVVRTRLSQIRVILIERTFGNGPPVSIQRILVNESGQLPTHD